MAGLKCNHCGCGIRYHGEPDGTELVMFTSKSWDEVIHSIYDPSNELIHTEYAVPSPYLYQADTIYDDFKGCYCKIWKCSKCGTLHIFNTENTTRVSSVYTPAEFSCALTTEDSYRYVIFDDILWNKITDLSIPNKKIPELFTPSFYASVTETGLVFFSDNKIPVKVYISEELQKNTEE